MRFSFSLYNRKATVLTVGYILFGFVAFGNAEIVTDGSLGPFRHLSGPEYQISQELGTTIGDNLFHSFQSFDIHPGESATFSGSESIRNVISRVTGGGASTIDGLLRSKIGTADFYFINPAGVVFGPNAQVDVPASFHVGTADEVRFADGSVLSAVSPTASTLTAADPESFGYLGSRVADIVVNDSQLTFAEEATVTFSGGGIAIEGTESDPAAIRVPGGTLRISAVGDGTLDVPFTGDLTGGGELRVAHARVETSADNGGTLNIAAKDAAFDAALLASDNMDGKGGDLKINAADRLMLENGSNLSASTNGKTDAGSVIISCRELMVEGGESDIVTGIKSDSDSAATGNGGIVRIDVRDQLDLIKGGQISSCNFGEGDAGLVEINAGNLRIDRAGSAAVTAVASGAQVNSSGNAGTVKINVADLLEILNGGFISSSTAATGNAGEVQIETGNCRIDHQTADFLTGIFSIAENGSSGAAGRIEMTVGDLLEIYRGGKILSSTFSVGDAGGITVNADRLLVDGGRGGVLTQIASTNESGSSGNAGSVILDVTGSLDVLSGGLISSSTSGAGHAGGVYIKAGELHIDHSRISSDVLPGATGNGGQVNISVSDEFDVVNGAQISSSTFGAGNAGGMEIVTKDLYVDGRGAAVVSGLFSTTESNSLGNAGTIAVTAGGRVDVVNGGVILSSTFSSGYAGEVIIDAADLRVDGQSAGAAGIASSAEYNSTGRAGTVTVRVTGDLEVLEGGQISSSTWGGGDAGNVTVQAGNTTIERKDADSFTWISSNANRGSTGNAGQVLVQVDGLLEILGGAAWISSVTYGQGNAGAVRVDAGSLRIDSREAEYDCGIESNSKPGSSGQAGKISLKVSDDIEMMKGSHVLSSTYGEGNAGSVEIMTGSIEINGEGSGMSSWVRSSAEPGSFGNAGKVSITATEGVRILGGGDVASGTWGEGNAGGVEIEAKQMVIDALGASLFTGVSSGANAGSSGDAGYVIVKVEDQLTVQNGGQISSSTFSAGNAGNILVKAGELKIDGQHAGSQTGINSAAAPSAQGFSGNVDIEAETVTVKNGAAVSVQNQQIVPEEKLSDRPLTHLLISSAELALDTDAAITAASWGNVPAAAVQVTSDSIRLSDFSVVTTYSTNANGGPITLDTQVIDIQNSMISSSVTGRAGNGGDIIIGGKNGVKALILETGFIQANAPAGARGGDIFINADALIPSGGALEIGGSERKSFTLGKSIIQAAAPGGEQGNIDITSPEMDISGALIGLDARLAEPARLAADPCVMSFSALGSSLVFNGSGGIPLGLDQHSVLFLNADRKDRAVEIGEEASR